MIISFRIIPIASFSHTPYQVIPTFFLTIAEPFSPNERIIVRSTGALTTASSIKARV